MIEFLTPAHQRNYLEAASQLQFTGRLPADWTACLYLMTASDSVWRMIRKHVNLQRHEIEWRKVRKLTLSSGEMFLMNLAQQLYNNSGEVDLSALWETLDDQNYQLAIRALHVRRQGARVLQIA